jgi:hypothetical protein
MVNMLQFVSYNEDKEATYWLYISGPCKRCRRELPGGSRPGVWTINLTQSELAARSGVTFSSLKRFEREGLIALDSLLSLALVLNCLDDFDKLAIGKPGESQPLQSLDALLATPVRRRAATGRKGRSHGI